jgi:hypothetical protein
VVGATCDAGDCTGEPYNCSEFDDTCHEGTCYDDGGEPACQSDPLPEGAFCFDTDPSTFNDVCDASALCVGESLPLSTDESGYLSIRIHEPVHDLATPLCAQLTVNTVDNEGLLVTLTSPAQTVATLHDHAPGATPLELSVETSAFALEDRMGDWILEIFVDDAQNTVTVSDVLITFATCQSSL